MTLDTTGHPETPTRFNLLGDNDWRAGVFRDLISRGRIDNPATFPCYYDGADCEDLTDSGCGGVPYCEDDPDEPDDSTLTWRA